MTFLLDCLFELSVFPLDIGITMVASGAKEAPLTVISNVHRNGHTCETNF